jgi:hypothetical protein
MHLSEARINANRSNSLKSTGPTSSAGKNRSRANAVKHGFCATVVDVEDPEAVRARTEEISMTPVRANDMAEWAATQVATMSVKIERCQQSELAIRQRIVSRAEVTWDEDRQLEATLLGENLAKHPERVSARLRETLHGCLWMLNRWALLAYSGQLQGGWTPEQASLAFDLLGIPRAFREGNRPGTEIDAHGQVIATPEDLTEVAREQIAKLLELKERLIPLDQAERERTQAGQADHVDSELRNHRRYEASLQRRLEWSMKLLMMLRQSETALETEKEPKAESTAKVPSKNPAFDLPPNGPPSRTDKKLMKADSRREARQRKLEKRLA